MKCFRFVCETRHFRSETYRWKARFVGFLGTYSVSTSTRVLWEISKKVTIVLPKFKCKQQTVAARDAITSAVAADGQLAYSWMHATAQYCTAHGSDSPPRRGPFPNYFGQTCSYILQGLSHGRQSARMSKIKKGGLDHPWTPWSVTIWLHSAARLERVKAVLGDVTCRPMINHELTSAAADVRKACGTGGQSDFRFMIN